MKSCTRCNIFISVAGVIGLLVISAAAIPTGSSEERPDNYDLMIDDTNNILKDLDNLSWQNIDGNDLKRFFDKYDYNQRLAPRSIRSWPNTVAAPNYARSLDNRLSHQWRADKRQARFRQCYFNPISCFRK